MPRKKNKKKEGSSKAATSLQKWSVRSEVSPNCSEVTPSDLKSIVRRLKAVRQADTYTMLFILDSVLTTDGSGVAAGAIGDAPSTDANWASAASLFDEYRTLGTYFKFSPKLYVGSTNFVFSPIVTVVDLDTASNLTGYTLASQYSSCVEHKAGVKFTRIMPMTGLENADFISTGSPASKCYIKYYTSGNTASTDLGRFQAVHVVQFRGKGI